MIDSFIFTAALISEMCKPSIRGVSDAVAHAAIRPYVVLHQGDLDVSWFDYVRQECKLLGKDCGYEPVASNPYLKQSLHFLDPQAPNFDTSLIELNLHILRHSLEGIEGLRVEEALARFNIRDIQSGFPLFLEVEFSDFKLFSNGHSWNDTLAGFANQLQRAGSIEFVGHDTVSFIDGSVENQTAVFRVDVRSVEQARRLDRYLILMEAMSGVKALKQTTYDAAYHRGRFATLDPGDYVGQVYVYIEFDPKYRSHNEVIDWVRVLLSEKIKKVSEHNKGSKRAMLLDLNLATETDRQLFKWILSLRGREGVIAVEPGKEISDFKEIIGSSD